VLTMSSHPAARLAVDENCVLPLFPFEARFFDSPWAARAGRGEFARTHVSCGGGCAIYKWSIHKW
jgi:hypothetical protein